MSLRSLIENDCNHKQKYDFLIDFFVNSIFLLTIYSKAIFLLKNKRKQKDGAEKGFLSLLENRVTITNIIQQIKWLVFVLSANVFYFYGMTFLWNEKFDLYFKCTSDDEFVSKTAFGDFILLVVYMTVLMASSILNIFFYQPISESTGRITLILSRKVSKIGKLLE